MNYIPLVRPCTPNFEELETDIRSSIESGLLDELRAVLAIV